MQRSQKSYVSRIILILGSVLFFSLIFVLTRDNGFKVNQEKVVEGSPTKTIVLEDKNEKLNEKVVIDFGDGNKIEAEVQAQNVLEALNIAAHESDLTVSLKQYDFGQMVISVGSKKNDSTRFWMYKVNGKIGDKAADSYKIFEGDTVEWEYSSLNN